MRTLTTLILTLAITLPLGGDVTVVVGQKPVVAGGGSTVTYDTSAESAAGVNASTRTVTITVANQANRLLVVFGGAGDDQIGDRTMASASSDLSGAFTAVTGGSADDGNWTAIKFFRLINPAVGTHTITVTAGSTCQQMMAMAISLYGVDQTTPIGTATAVNGSTPSATPTGAVTLGADDMAVGGITTDSGGSLSFTSGTGRQTELNVDSDTAYGLATHTGTGSVSITASTASEPYSLVVLPVNGAP